MTNDWNMVRIFEQINRTKVNSNLKEGFESAAITPTGQEPNMNNNGTISESSATEIVFDELLEQFTRYIEANDANLEAQVKNQIISYLEEKGL